MNPAEKDLRDLVTAATNDQAAEPPEYLPLSEREVWLVACRRAKELFRENIRKMGLEQTEELQAKDIYIATLKEVHQKIIKAHTMKIVELEIEMDKFIGPNKK
jgi:hypothetical protein